MASCWFPSAKRVGCLGVRSEDVESELEFLKEAERVSVTAAKGFLASGVWSAIKGSGKPDLSLIVSETPAAAAGVFTTNRFRAAPVEICVGRLKASGGRARAIVATSGCANALTGSPGTRDALAISREASRLLKVPDRLILIASTGAIAPRLPVARVKRGLRKAVRVLGRGSAAGMAAARGILTTDTGPKQAAERFTDGGVVFQVGGIAKGVGMVAPNMATILGFITTDAQIGPRALAGALKVVAEGTFNEITVDGQMSTNDTVLVLANGAASGRPLSTAGYAKFLGALGAVCGNLARELVRDGEGATRLIRIVVRRARSAADARLAARAVADSSLVKTMFYGRQPNWGRLAQALGACGARFDPARVVVKVAGTVAIRGGICIPARFDIMTKLADPEVAVDIDLNAGRHLARVLTCDLTEQYVRINAGYLS